MSLLRLNRLSVIWKNWMFNQDAEISAAASLQVENTSDSDDGALQRDGSQQHSRRRFRKVNPRGERQLITDNQDPSPTVRCLHIRSSFRLVYLQLNEAYVVHDK